MGVIISIGTVFFIILCALLVIVILLQSDKSAGMGILGGSSQSAFGSSTADVITKITTVMVAIFLIGSLGLSVLESRRVSSLTRELKKIGGTQKGTIKNINDKKTDSKDQGTKQKKSDKKK